MKRTTLVLALVTSLFLFALGLPQAHAFTHPGVPNSLEELDTIKANLNQEPWKSGYAALASASTSQLNWQMDGPYANVSRKGSYDQNLVAWQNSMNAVYNLARMWYFTGNNAYAQKAHDILLAWATTHVSFSGNESGLALGDYAASFGGGASILRGTWPGWTAADTVAVQNYFSNVLWPASAGWPTQGPANKGAIYLEAGIAIAVFCDNDPSKFDHVMNMFRTFHGTCLMDTLPTGQLGETGRDAGHAFGMLNAMTFVAECAWKQGVDLYSELDNRMLACGEYYARNTFTTDNPYVYFGTIDWQWISNKPGPYTANRGAFYLLQNAYKNRKGLPTPWIDRKLQEQNVDANNFMYAKTADFTTATLTPASFPSASPASGGLTLTTLGTQTANSSASYANGVWTMTGLGNGVWSDTADDCQFAYTQMTGDCAMVAKITSNQYPNAQARAGLMIRDNLTATVGQRAWIGAVSAPTMMKMEAHMRGWTSNWGGGGYDDRSHDWPPGLPYWIKIERRDKQISTFASPDGTSWSPLTCTYYGNLPSTLYIGLFVCSGTTTTNTATFENVAFTGGTGGLVTTPAAPLGLLASGSNKAITLRWLASYGATAYDVLRSTTSGSGYTVIASNLTAAKTSYVDTTAAAGTTYYYVVQAKNAVDTSGNSPEFGAALLSAPMANLAFGGTTLASFNTGSQVGGSDTAFDRDPGSKWYGYNSPTGWLQYDFGASNAQVVKRYTINCADVADRDPKNWNFLGSQDGSTWTPLDSQSNQSFVIRMGMNTYDITNTTAYRYYRLDITANNGAGGVAIGDLGLWGDSGHTLPDGRYRLVNRKSNKVVDVTATTNGAPLVQWGWNGAGSQQWDIAWQGNGRYRATGVASAKVIDNGGTANTGANLVIQPSSGATSQLWTIVSDSDGFLRIESANSGLVADVSGGSTADGVNIVQSTYTGGDSQLWMPSIGVAPQPIPAAPTGLAATAASISQINLSWTASSGAISYTIKRATVSGGPYTTVAVSVNTPSYSDTGLLSSTTYYYVVSAVNGSGESSNSTQANSTTLTAPPAAPTGLTTVLGANQVTLNWAASGGATSYTVKRATTSGGPYTTVASGVTATSYTDTGLTNGVAYYYVISASNANGTGADSAEISVTTSTLVVQLKFDESTGTTAADSSGRANHATLVNGPTFAAGKFVNALTFPATASQHAKLPNGVTSGVNDFTVSTWVKLSGTSNNTRIFDFGTGTNNYMELCPKTSANGFVRYEIVSGGTTQQINTTYTFPTGVWTHVALTQSGTTGTLYINGTSVGTNTGLTLKPSTLGTTTLNYIGRSQWSADPYLNGTLDDFRFYSQAMSASEINALAHPAAGAPVQFAVVPGDTQATLTWLPNATDTYTIKRATTSGGAYTTIATGVTALTYTDTGLTNGTTYYYVVSGANADGSGPDSAEVSTAPNTLAVRLKFDESSGTVAADSSGRNFNATLVNGPAFATGVMNNGLGLNSASSQYATLPSAVVSGMGDFTVSTWVKVNAFATWQRIFDFGTGTTNYMFLTTQYTTTAPNAAKLRFAIRTPSVSEQTVSGTSIALSTGTWTHVAVTRSGTTVSIYVNGSLAGSGTIALKPSDLGTTTLNYLGKSQFADPYLNASLDEFRIYSRALSTSEITIMATVLPAPASLTATAGTSQVALSWNSVSGASGYNVKRATTSGGPYATIKADNASTSYTDTTAVNGTTYYYVVSATNMGGESAASSEVSATPLAPPAVPADLTAFADDATISLNWTASTGAASYNVKRATTPGGAYTTIASGVTGTSYTDNDLSSGTTYYYVVSGVNPVAESANSAEASATTIPAAPTGLTTTPGNGQVALSWSSATGAVSYTVKSATTSGGSYTTVATGVTATSYTDTGLSNGTTYYYVVTAVNGTGESASSAEASALTIPGSPTGVTATAGNGQVALSWTASTGASGYTILRATSPNGSYTTIASGVAGTNYTDTGLSNGTTYYYAVVATNGSGSSANSSQTNAITAPAAPTGLAATPGTQQVALSWTASTGAASYNVKRSVTSGSGYTTVATGVTTTSYTNTGLSDGTTYYYVVTAVNGGGESASSAEVSALTIPGAPTGITATAGNGQVSLNWTASPGATSYTVLRATSPNGSYTTVATGITGTSYTDTGLANGTTYYYAVVATNGSGSSANSSQVNAVTVPPAPVGLSASASGTQVNLSWTAASGATTYTVKRSTTSGGSYTVVASGVTGTSYTNTGLTAGTTYYYVVSATNTAGESANSSEVSGATVPAAPTGLASSGSGTQINLSWNAATGATTYNVKRSITSGGSYVTIASGVTATSYTDTGLIPAATYYYVVTGTNATGEGSASAETSTTLVPLAPTGLSAIGWNGAVDLSWTGASGSTSYKVKRATTSGGSYTTIATGVTGTTYSDTTAVNGTTYYYVVSSNNAGGESVNSAEASTTFTQPVAYLKFDETTGTSAADSSGNGWTGTLVNGPLWSAGRSNNTVDLDGVNDHVTLPTGVVSTLNNFTITLWANLDTLSTWSRLFDFGTGSTVNMFLTPKNGSNSKIRFAITTGGANGEQRIDGTAALPIGGWHHVAVTLNGSTGTLYVDGVQVGQNTAMTLKPSSLGSTTLNRIGRSQYNDPYLMGRIDEFRIYGRALSAAEVASLMNTSPAGLVSAPASLTATAGTAQVALNWSAVSGATSYDVMRTTTSGGLYAPVATGLTTTTYTNTGLTTGTTYYYVLVARTATSESPNSPVASATAQ